MGNLADLMGVHLDGVKLLPLLSLAIGLALLALSILTLDALVLRILLLDALVEILVADGLHKLEVVY